MRPESAKLLWDIHDVATSILRITEKMTYEDFISTSDIETLDARAAVERYFEIAGEACRKLRDSDPQTAQLLPGLHGAIGTRNVIAHEYDEINYRLLWSTIERDVPALLEGAEKLLEEYGPPR